MTKSHAIIRVGATGLVALLMAGCASSTESTSAQESTTTVVQAATTIGQTTQPLATTQAAPSTTQGLATTTEAAGNLGTISQECVDVFQAWIVDLEPVVAGFDFDNASLEEFQLLQVELVPVFQLLAAGLGNNNCLDAAADPTFDVWTTLLAFAQTQAPGAIAYLELQQAMPASESCQSDIDALQSYVDRGGTVFDLTTEERFHAFSLFGSILMWCSLQTGGEYTNRDEVVAFLGIG